MAVPPTAFEVKTEEGNLAATGMADRTITTNLWMNIVPGQEEFLNRLLTQYGTRQQPGITLLQPFKYTK